MTMANLTQIYDWFMTGKKPTQAQFWASWGSFWNKEESIPQSAISNLSNTLNAKAEKAQFDAHKTANDAHQALFDLKQSLTDKGAQGGYAPLDEFTKLAAEYLNIVDDVVTGGSTMLLSAEQGKVLQGRIDTINGILFSDNVNMDTVQEIVDAIESVQSFLDTILVNDLTTGGVTKALTAEMGKSLKALIDGLESNKVDKVAGKSLISDAEITRLAGVSNVDISGKIDWALTDNTIPGVSYIFALTDYKKNNRFTSATAVAATVPTNSTVAIPIGVTIACTVEGAGAVTLGGAGITFVQRNLTFVQGDTFYLKKVATDTWAVEGNLTGVSPSSTNVFTAIQKFTTPTYLVDDNTSSSSLSKMIVRSNPSNTATTNPRMFDFVVSGYQGGNTGWHGGINFIDNHNPTEVLMMSLKTTGTNTVNAVVYGNLTVNGTFVQAFINLTRNSNNILLSNYNDLGFNIYGLTSSPYRIVEFEALASGGSGWHAKQMFYVKSNNDTVRRLAIEIQSQDSGTPLVKLYGTVSVTGTFTVVGALTASSIILSRTSDVILNAGTYNGHSFIINGVSSSPYKIIEFRNVASTGAGWHAKTHFYVKSFSDSTERIAIELESQDNGTPLINLPGIVKPNQLNLSNLGSYADDAAAATAGVAVGYGYINSSTGALHRRLT